MLNTVRLAVEHYPVTGEELYRMSNLGPVDLVRGKLVQRLPTEYAHGLIAANLCLFLGSYLRKHKTGKGFSGQIGVYTERNPDTVRGVALAYMSRARYVQVKSTSYLDVAPELIVEVLSPNDAWSEVQEKLAEYFAINVKVVWVVDPKLQQVHSYQALDQIHIYRIGDTLTCEEVLPGFRLPVTELFAHEEFARPVRSLIRTGRANSSWVESWD